MSRTWKVTLQLFCLFLVFFSGMYGKKLFKKKHVSSGDERVFAVLEHKPFVIVIPSFNNGQWVEKNLKSVLEQKYDNFRVIFIDDASTDSTYGQALEIARSSPQGFRVEFMHNERNRGAAENYFRAISCCIPQEIVLMLDGDDWLAHDRVLQRLNEVYADPDVWMTGGTYLEYPSYSYTVGKYVGEIPQKVLETNSLRTYLQKAFPISHLKTFYAALFHRIHPQDLSYEGHFFDAASDQAIIVPIAEMSGKHYRRVKDILYIYNRATALNDDKLKGERQLACAKEIWSRSAYSPLDKLWDQR